MQITHLSLTNFRNYGRLELDFPAGVVVLEGKNAQGKTNLLEALYYLATTRSPHTYQDDQLIHWEAGMYGEPVVVGRIVADVEGAEGRQHLELRLIREHKLGTTTLRREALVDRRKVRLMDLLGQLRVVLFLPEDLNLVTGPPAGRRRYLDVTLCQTDRAYCRALANYNKVLEQRNALLRRLAEQGMRANGDDLLAIYTDKAAEWGSRILARRAVFLTEMGRRVQRIHYEALTAGQESLRLGYLPALTPPEEVGPGEDEAETTGWLAAHQARLQPIAARLRQGMHEAQAVDLARGSTTLGPHRDDWRFWVNGRNLSDYGSRGQQRSAILALKMAEIDWMVAETGEAPLLLLDDMLAELDQERRELVLAYVSRAVQAVITTTDLTIFPPTFLHQATVLQVAAGRSRPAAIS